MNQSIDLKNLEKRAFRSAHQDGLWDIYIGGMIASMATLAFSSDSDAFPIVRFSIFLIGLGLSFFIFWAGKKFITTPRLGQVKFGPTRQHRKRNLALVLAGLVTVQAAIILGSWLLSRNPEWAARPDISQADPNLERLIVAVIAAMFVGPGIALISYSNEFMRGYYIAFIASLGAFSMVWFDQPIYLIACGLLIIIPGVVLFARFLRQHPRPPVEVTHD